MAGDVVPEEAVMLAALRRTGMTWKDARAQVDAWRAVAVDRWVDHELALLMRGTGEDEPVGIMGGATT